MVEETLRDLGESDRLSLMVLNKIDATPEDALEDLRKRYPNAVAVSAKTSQGLDQLRDALGESLGLVEDV